MSNTNERDSTDLNKGEDPLPLNPSNHTTARILGQLAGYYAAFFILGATIASLGPALPALAEQVGWRVEQLGFLFSTRSLGYLLGALFIGRWYDRLAGHSLLAGMLIGLAISNAMIPLSPSIVVLALALLTTGLWQGGVDVGNNTLLAWTFQQRAAPYLNGLFFFGGVGSFAIPLMINWSLETSQTLRPAFWWLSGLMLPIALWILTRPSPHSRDEQRTDHQPPAKPILVIAFGALIFAYIGLEVSFGGWIYTYLIKQGVAGPTLAATLTSLFWLAITIGRLVAIPLSSRVPARQLIGLNLVGVIISLVIILFWPRQPTAAALGTLGVGFFLASLFPTTFSLAGRSITISGKLAGRLWASGSAGAMVIPWLAGQSMEWLTPSAMLAMLLAVIGAAGLVYGYVLRELGPEKTLKTTAD